MRANPDRSPERIDRNSLARELARGSIVLPDAALTQLWKYHQLLRSRNAELNLTRIHNFDNMVRKHYVDSLLVLNILAESGIPLPRRLIDLGSGPGLPGIPLAIGAPEMEVILAEGRGNRADFLGEAIAEVGLENATVHAHRIGPSSRLDADAVITRAVEKIPETLSRVSHLLPPHGLIIFMKGPSCDSEIARASDRPDLTARFRLLLDHAYRLADSRDHRRLIVYRKIADGHMPDFIESADNARFKRLRSLLTARGIKKHGEALLSGEKAILDLIERDPGRIIQVLLSEDHYLHEHGWIQKLETAKTLQFSRTLFNELDVIGTRSPLVVLSTPALEMASEKLYGEAGVHLLLPLSDPENLGAALRTAAAFAVRSVTLLEEAANPFLPRSLRASAGATLHLNLFRGPSIQEIGPALPPTYALDLEGESLQTVAAPHRCALLVGEEGKGVPDRLDVIRIRIPQTTSVDSLNANVALAVALYEWSR